MSFNSIEISLTGGEDYDQHYRTPNDIRLVSTYDHEKSTGQIHANDTIWGDEVIGNRPKDEVLVELFENPLVNRLSGIEQLTLPKRFTTMPNSYGFMRWEHAWGSVIFVRKMIDKARLEGRNIDDQEAMTLQLRTFVSDIGHTAFSHLGDWLFQGFGGTEDQHDTELNEVLEAGGVNDILRKHGYKPDEIVFPDIEDWIECSSPDLCVDRVDYGAREIGRWVNYYTPSSEWLNKFSVDSQDRIIISDKQTANQFALGFNLLATEHWGHPVHRLQVQLFAEMVKGIISDNILTTEPGIYHPRDVLYDLDSKISGYANAVGSVNYELSGLLLDMGRAQRKAFQFYREQELLRFVEHYTSKHSWASNNDEYPGFPHPLKRIYEQDSSTSLLPNNVQMIQVIKNETEVSDYGQLPYSFDVFLPPLKPRSIDPLYYDPEGKVQRLSEADSKYKDLLAEQRSIQAQAYVARWYGSPEFIANLRKSIHEVNLRWEKMLGYERADRATMSQMFKYIGRIPVRNGEWLRITRDE